MAEGDDTSLPYMDDEEPAMDRGDGKGAETTPPPIPSRPHHQQGNTRFDVEKAWDHLWFNTTDHRTIYKKEATDYIEPCKLQFVLNSQVTIAEFYARLMEGVIFKVLTAGYVDVEVDSSKLKEMDKFWSALISSVVNALKSKLVKTITFSSKENLETALQNLDSGKQLVLNGLVGVFFTSAENSCVAKFVGTEDDVNSLCEEINAVRKDRAVTEKHMKTSAYHKAPQNTTSRTLQSNTVGYVSLSVDEISYLETVKFKDHFRVECPAVELIETTDVDNGYKLTCSDEKALQHALKMIAVYRSEIKKKEVDLPLEDIRFLNYENVKFHLLRKLKIVPAYAEITTDRIFVWCRDSSKFDEAAEVINNSCDAIEAEGCMSPEVQSIQDDSHGKIQLYSKAISSRLKIIRFTKDERSNAEKMARALNKNRYRKEHYDQLTIQALTALGILSELEKGFTDVMIEVDEGKSVVKLQGSTFERIDACFEDLKVNVRRIEHIPLDFLSNSAQNLLANENVRIYVHEMVREEGIAFVENEQKSHHLVCLKAKSIVAVKEAIKKCFVDMNIDKDCLESDQARDLLENHYKEIIREDCGETFCLCFTLNLKEEVEGLLSPFRKECRSIVIDFLQTFGAEGLETIAEKHNVRAEIKGNCVCFKGRYDDGKEAMDELERFVETAVLHFDDDDKSLLTSQKRQKVDTIAKRHKCSWNAVATTHDESVARNSNTEGIEYLTTWKLNKNKGQISVTEVNYKTAKLDGLIIPVNESLYGEDILGKDADNRPYSEFCSLLIEKLAAGMWKPLELGEKCACTSCVALVVSDIAIVDKVQTPQCISASKLEQSVADILHDFFSKGVCKIGFAIPSGDPNFKEKLKAISSGYLRKADEFADISDIELLLCVRSSAEWWIQELDSCLKKIECTKRQVFPRYYGLFEKPDVSTKITMQSLLDVQADCLVVAVSKELKLSKGYVSRLISEACGSQLQKELNTKYAQPMEFGDLIMVDSFRLSRRGVKKLIFGALPYWNACKKTMTILESFVQESLLLADSGGCSTVAFPVLGTGKLAYPLRDAMVTVMDGIDQYVSEATIGHVSTVYIAVPGSDDADFMSKILDTEQKRRKAQDTVDVKQSKTEDDQFLIAEEGSVRYCITNEDTCRVLSSGRHVDVYFKPVIRKKFETAVDIRPGCIVGECNDSKEGLQDAAKEIIHACEREKITSLNVFCSKEFSSLSEADQTDTFIFTARKTVYMFDVQNYPIRGVYKYLKNVTMVTSDAGFSAICSLKLCDNTQPKKGKTFFQTFSSISSTIWDPLGKTVLQWNQHSCKPRKTFLNVMLAGSMDSNIEKAKQDVRDLFTTKLDTRDSHDSGEFDDEVSAELNPGIVKYLKKIPATEFHEWRHRVKVAFNVRLIESDSADHIVITGLFENILKTEHYLENEFPNLPVVDNLEEQNLRHNIMKSTPLKIPILKEDKPFFMYFFSKEIEAISNHPQITEISTHEDFIRIKCSTTVKEEVKSRISKLLSKVKQLHKKIVNVQSKEVLSTVLKMNFPTGVFCQPNENTNSLEIISREQSLIDQAENIILDAERKNTKHAVRLQFLIQKVIFRINHLKVTIHEADITDMDMDCIVTPVNEIMNHDFGVANAIARKAGKKYLDECLDVLKRINNIGITECVYTKSGKLKCRHILHVHAPVRFEEKRKYEQLLEITQSVKHCFEKAEDLKSSSIAIPFLCTGRSDFPVEHCAQQYFRALKDFQHGEYLQEIHLVDLDQEKVSGICRMMSECMQPVYKDIYQTHIELTVKTALTDMKFYITQGEIHSVECDVVVIGVDKNLCCRGGELEQILALAGQQFKQTYEEQKYQHHPCTGVSSIKSDGGLISKSVLFAVTPTLQNDEDNYAKQIRITTQHILEKTCELHHTSIAMSVLCCEEDTDALTCCCRAMMESVLQFCKDKKNNIKTVQFLSPQETEVSMLCHALSLELKNEMILQTPKKLGKK